MYDFRARPVPTLPATSLHSPPFLKQYQTAGPLDWLHLPVRLLPGLVARLVAGPDFLLPRLVAALVPPSGLIARVVGGLESLLPGPLDRPDISVRLLPRLVARLAPYLPGLVTRPVAGLVPRLRGVVPLRKLKSPPDAALIYLAIFH